MQELHTKTFALQPNDYFKIILLNSFSKWWLLYLSSVALALLNLKDFGQNSFITFIVIFGFMYPPLQIVFYYTWAHSKKNIALFIPRKMIIQSEKITVINEDENISEVSTKYIFKIIERKLFWQLYVTKGSFLYIPKSAFNSIEDENEFRKLITKNKV